jgi:hypothetical protein
MQIDTDVVGFDVDGVIAPRSWDMAKKWPLFRSQRLNEFVWLIPVLAHYMLRSPILPAKQLVLQEKQAGKKIVFISAIWIFFLPFLWIWLKWHRIPHDKILLRLPGVSREAHKAKAIYKLGCCYYIDDDKALMDRIMGELLEIESCNRLESMVQRLVQISILKNGIGWRLSREVKKSRKAREVVA